MIGDCLQGRILGIGRPTMNTSIPVLVLIPLNAFLSGGATRLHGLCFGRTLTVGTGVTGTKPQSPTVLRRGSGSRLRIQKPVWYMLPFNGSRCGGDLLRYRVLFHEALTGHFLNDFFCCLILFSGHCRSPPSLLFLLCQQFPVPCFYFLRLRSDKLIQLRFLRQLVLEGEDGIAIEK